MTKKYYKSNTISKINISFDFYFRHIEYPIYTAVAVTEMDFERIDINQCPKGRGK